MLEKYPNSDELMYAMGLILEKQGEEGKAMEWYRRCQQITRNGMLLMKIPELPPLEDEEDDLTAKEG